MKAKEWAKKFGQASTLEQLNKAMCEYVTEMNEVIAQRNCQSFEAIQGTVNKFQIKWEAICRIMPIMKMTGFKDWIRERANDDELKYILSVLEKPGTKKLVTYGMLGMRLRDKTR